MSEQAFKNVTDDPVEEWDLIEKRLDCAWVFAPVGTRLASLQQSAARYPHIKPGQEFGGCVRAVGLPSGEHLAGVWVRAVVATRLPGYPAYREAVGPMPRALDRLQVTVWRERS